MKREQITSHELAFPELGKLAAGLLHDIRSPLSYLLNLSQLSLELLDEWEEGNSEKDSIAVNASELNLLRKNLTLMKKHAALASRLIRISYGFLGGTPEVKTHFELESVIQDWANVVIASWKENNPDFSFSVKYQFSPDLPQFYGQEGIIAQVLMNLIQNALFSLHARASQACDYAPELTIELSFSENQFLLKISDNGTGISTHDLEEIFIPGFTTKSANDGTGMGLYFSREAIRSKMGGDIKVESRVNEFTQLSVNLPLGDVN